MYADQLKDNRAGKKCRQKKDFYFILTVIVIVFSSRDTPPRQFLALF